MLTRAAYPSHDDHAALSPNVGKARPDAAGTTFGTLSFHSSADLTRTAHVLTCQALERNVGDVSSLKPTTFRLETEIMDALNQIRERDGIPVSEQVRRALKQWIDAKGGVLKPASKRSRKADAKRRNRDG